MDYEFVPGRDDFPPDEVAMLRQQLAAALAACEMKDFALRVCEVTIQRRFGKCCELSKTQAALAIKPDASALKAHDEALIERCAQVCVALERPDCWAAKECTLNIRLLKDPS